jgi:hypothetical protein
MGVPLRTGQLSLTRFPLRLGHSLIKVKLTGQIRDYLVATWQQPVRRITIGCG